MHFDFFVIFWFSLSKHVVYLLTDTLEQHKVDNVDNAVEALKTRYQQASEAIEGKNPKPGWGGFNAKLGSPVGKKFMKEWFGNSFAVTTEINQKTGNRKLFMISVTMQPLYQCIKAIT